MFNPAYLTVRTLIDEAERKLRAATRDDRDRKGPLVLYTEILTCEDLRIRTLIDEAERQDHRQLRVATRDDRDRKRLASC